MRAAQAMAWSRSAAVEEVVAAEHLLGLGERAVGGDDLAALAAEDAHGGGGVGGLQGVAAREHAGGPGRLAEGHVVGVHLGRDVVGTVHLLVGGAVDQSQVLGHRGVLLWRAGACRRSSPPRRSAIGQNDSLAEKPAQGSKAAITSTRTQARPVTSTTQDRSAVSRRSCQAAGAAPISVWKSQ